MKPQSFNNTVSLFPSTNQGSRIKKKKYHIFLSLLLSLQLTCQRLLRWNESRVSIINKTPKLTDKVTKTGRSPTGFAGSTYQNSDTRLCRSQQLTCSAPWLLGIDVIKSRTTHFILLHKPLFQGIQQESKTEHKLNMCHRGLSY